MGKIFYPWADYNRDARQICQRVKKTGLVFDGVWGMQRGSLMALERGAWTFAVTLSHGLGLNLRFFPTPRTLICDDIADTGRALSEFKDFYIVALWYCAHSLVEPNIWQREKLAGDHVVFPWEINDWPDFQI